MAIWWNRRVSVCSSTRTLCPSAQWNAHTSSFEHSLAYLT